MMQPALRVAKAPTTIILIIFQSGKQPGWAARATPQVEGNTRSHVPIGLSNLINRKYASAASANELFSFLLVEKHLWGLSCTWHNESPEGVQWLITVLALVRDKLHLALSTYKVDNFTMLLHSIYIVYSQSVSSKTLKTSTRALITIESRQNIVAHISISWRAHVYAGGRPISNSNNQIHRIHCCSFMPWRSIEMV